MSYILDALRRADAERERGSVPGVHAQPTRTVPGPPTLARPAASRWLLAALAVPVLMLIAWLTWRVSTNDAGTALPTPAALATPAAAPMPSLAPAPAPSVPFNPTGEAPALTEAPRPAPAREVLAPSATRKALPGATANGVRPTLSRSPQSTSSGALQVSTGAAQARVYGPDELPDEVRRDLPKLAIGGSTYSESSSSRFLIVNGQLCHEGDTLAPGLVLQQIKQKSAVLAFRGYRYSIVL